MEFTKEENLHEIFAEEVIDMQETNEIVSLVLLKNTLNVNADTAYNIYCTLKNLDMNLIDPYTNTIEDMEIIELTWQRLLKNNSR